jgi:AcrR family transcriptional regulator
MKLSSDDEPARPSLRERKKAKTRALIRQQARRLFREQGYSETTVEQIAEAAEVSPSTFFRYFPTKEDVVVRDEFDTMIAELFAAQPAELSTIEAMRMALRAVYDNMSAEELAWQMESLELIRAVPELRATILDELIKGVQLVAAVIAKRVGRRADELEVRTFAGAIIGVIITSVISNPAPTDYIAQMDASLAALEAGIKL